MNFEIHELKKEHIKEIAEAFKKIGWNKPASQYQRYLKEQTAGKRVVLVAFYNGKFAGYVTIVWQSKYPNFKKNNIPEIVDLNVLPEYQRQKIGTRLIDEAEKIIVKKSKVAGIGVGLAPDYRFAQKMYVKSGYIPDAQPITYKNKYVTFGQKVIINDELVLHFKKRLK